MGRRAEQDTAPKISFPFPRQNIAVDLCATPIAGFAPFSSVLSSNERNAQEVFPCSTLIPRAISLTQNQAQLA
jgi:hypothetical protein